MLKIKFSSQTRLSIRKWQFPKKWTKRSNQKWFNQLPLRLSQQENKIDISMSSKFVWQHNYSNTDGITQSQSSLVRDCSVWTSLIEILNDTVRLCRTVLDAIISCKPDLSPNIVYGFSRKRPRTTYPIRVGSYVIRHDFALSVVIEEREEL